MNHLRAEYLRMGAELDQAWQDAMKELMYLDHIDDNELTADPLEQKAATMCIALVAAELWHRKTGTLLEEVNP